MNDPSTENVIRDVQVDEEEISLRESFHVLSRYKWAIIGLTSIVTILSALYVNTLPRVYRATAIVMLESEGENVVKIEQVYGMPNAYYEYYQTQLGVIRSRGMVERLVYKLNLVNHPAFDPSRQQIEQPGFSWKKFFRIDSGVEDIPRPVLMDEAARHKSVIDAVAGMLSVSLVTDSQLIKVGVDSTDPELAALLANGMAEVYIQSGLDEQLEATRKATEWINVQMKDLKEKVDESERALQAFLDREKLVDAKGVDSIAVNTLDNISKQLIDAKRNRSEAEAIHRQVIALEGQPIEAYESIPAVLNHSAVQDAKSNQIQAAKKVKELEERYGQKHPKLIAAKAELDVANSNLRNQILYVVDSVKKEFAVTQAEESHLESSYHQTKQEIGDINRSGYELKTLEHEVESNRQLYDMFLTRLKETTVTDNLQTPNARIIERAIVPGAPYKPNKNKFILLSLIAGLLISLSLVFMIEKLDNTINDSNAVENKLFLPVLSILPRVNTWKTRERRKMRYFTDKKHSGFSENIRTIRTSILLNDIDTTGKTVLVTSSIPGEGKSMVSVNLALALAQMGKTLLIDGDMRKPVLAKVFGLQKHTGLTQFISGANRLEDSIHYFEEDKVYVMPVGQIPSNPLELLSSNRFEKSLEALKKAFTYIVIDSAPAVPVSDPVVLSRMVNTVIYVVKAHDTPFQVARTGIKKLQQVDANIIGVVLNQLNPAKRPGRYGYGEYDYYTYYGYHKS